MTERWKVTGTEAWLDTDAVLAAIAERTSRDQLTTWLESDAGRLIGWVTNHDRVMLVLLNEPGDPGEHAIDPDASGSSDGFIMDNSQSDEYADRDTVPAPTARAILRALVTTGRAPVDVPWQVDRA